MLEENLVMATQHFRHYPERERACTSPKRATLYVMILDVGQKIVMVSHPGCRNLFFGIKRRLNIVR